MTDKRDPSHETASAPAPNWTSALFRSWLGEPLQSIVRKAMGAQHRDTDARVAAALKPVLAWMSGAEVHLAALQRAADAGTATATALEPMIEWMSGAEAHLAELQADHERLRSLCQRQMAQLDRMVARAALLESRLDDLERADTAIAIAIAKGRVRDELQ